MKEKSQAFCAFKNRITASTTQPEGFLIFLLIFKCCKKWKNNRISALLTFVTKRLLKCVNIEMVQFVDLFKCCVQTAFLVDHPHIWNCYWMPPDLFEEFVEESKTLSRKLQETSREHEMMKA
jgi:hypothetical protein